MSKIVSEMVPSVQRLSIYLLRLQRSRRILTSADPTKEIPWRGQDIPWNGRTCLVLLYYVMKFLPNPDHAILSDTITRLRECVLEYVDVAWKQRGMSMRSMTEEKKRRIDETFVNCFMPEVQKFFRVPKVHQLSEEDKSLLKENEILAGFMDFLLQILDCEALTDSVDEQRYAPLQKELRFVLTFLGDIPFQCTELDQVKNILAEFEIVANEAGDFIYYCFFASYGVVDSRFDGGIGSLLESVALLNEKIKEHCSKFSELSVCITSKADAIDSLFIVNSLLEDLENMINGRVDLLIDDTKDHIKTIHEEMIFAQTFLKGIEVVQGVYKDDLREFSGQIRDAAYEVEYLGNSYVVGNIPIWYLNLRIPTCVQMIKCIGIRLQEAKKICDIKVSKVEKYFDKKLSLQEMETPMVEDDDVMVGFCDEKTKIFNDLIEGSKILQIISISGLPGLGKTTMAKTLYNDPASCDYFDERAWCVISQTYQKKMVLTASF